MDNRTKQLEIIRPVITIENKKASALELFQNKTLRPILKFQNDLIIAVFTHYLAEHKIKMRLLTDEKKEAFIHSVLKKNLQVKNLLIGLIVGHFTVEELLFYFNAKNELNKRMVELLIKRLFDQKEKL